MNDVSPVARLRAYDARFRDLPRALPGGAMEEGALWRGIGFHLAGVDLVAAMGEVREVLSEPLISRVPGAKPWVAGIANVRGRLVTMVDLAEFLGVPGSARVRGERALYVERGDLQVGLLVDGVFGAKQLPHSTRRADIDTAPEALQPYLAGCFVAGTERWCVFDVARVLSNPAFLNAAA